MPKNLPSSSSKLTCGLVAFLTSAAIVLIAIDQKAIAQSQATITQSAKDIQKLKSDVEQIRRDQSATQKDVTHIKNKLDETGWKALDFASQLSGAQWAMFGTGLGILSVVVAVAAFGAYQGLMRMMKSNLDRAAIRMEGRLTTAIRKEEARLQTEMDKRVQGIKEMMESSRQSVQARTFSLISYAFWEQHHVGTGTSASERDEKCRNVESAIHLSGLALECAMKTDLSGAEGEELITTIRSNRAFYITDLACLAKQDERLSNRFSEDQRKEAIALANAVLPTAIKRMSQDGDTRWPEWMESCCWVFWVLGEENQKKTTLIDLRRVYDHKNVTDEMKAWIRKRYFENKEPAWT